MRSLLKLFERAPRQQPQTAPPPPPPSAGAVMHAASAAETVPACGLIVIEIAARADQPGPATLRVFAGGGSGPALEKAVELTVDLQPHWVAVHGHLLPNGAAPVRLELAGARGERLAVSELTLQVRNDGPLAEATRRGLERGGTPLVVDQLDSTQYDYGDASLAAWHDGPPEAIEAHLADLAATGEATPDEIAALRHFAERGYLILPEVIGAEELERLNAALDDAVARKIEGYEWGASQRLHNLHRLYPAIDDLWRRPAILRMLGLIFGARAVPYQSLTYVFGSEQFHHQDTIVLTPFPAGRMCGVWTALEDIQADSGELVVYPGSHRLPRVYLNDLGIAKVGEDWTAFGDAAGPIWTKLLNGGFAPELYRPTAGTMLIWHENLMHGGRVRRDKAKSRRSIVGHYFAEGCVAYHDASGLAGMLTTAEAASASPPTG